MKKYLSDLWFGTLALCLSLPAITEAQSAAEAPATESAPTAAPVPSAPPPPASAASAGAAGEPAQVVLSEKSEAVPAPGPAEAAGPVPSWTPEVVEEERIFDTRIYGYIDTHIEKVFRTPAGVGPSGQTLFTENPVEYDIPNLNVMVQGQVVKRYRYFLNLAAPGSGRIGEDGYIGVRNAWVEAPLAGNYLQVRVGKTYRRFGLYNEILDAVPTFIGIEPPELFDKDHLLVTRTTNLMVHGSFTFGESALTYALTTGGDERQGRSVPIGADLRYDYGTSFRVGSSFYSTGGNAGPTRGVGDGSPAGGVLNWMSRDRYMVYGAYAQLSLGSFLLQLEYWQAEHDAHRNEAATLELAEAGLNQRQLNRFYVNGDPTRGVRNDNADYTVRTYYGRVGYEFDLGSAGTLTPYGQYDYYRNPETIANKRFGGDDEAGITDNGEFMKFTAGAVYRPVMAVALKVDGSTHVQKYNDESLSYWEVRSSLAYMWDLELK